MKFLIHIFAIALLLCCSARSPAHAAPFFSVQEPLLIAGTTFTGSFTLDPNAMPDSYSDSTHFDYENPGTLTVHLGADTFFAPIDSVIVTPGNDDTWRWLALTLFGGSLNGIPLPETDISLVLYGNTNSTSVLPVDFSFYKTGTFFDASNIQIAAYGPDGSHITYGKNVLAITSLVQVDPLATFDFGGSVFAIPPGPTPLPATLPLFATGLGGLGVLGWRRKRKRKRQAARN